GQSLEGRNIHKEQFGAPDALCRRHQQRPIGGGTHDHQAELIANRQRRGYLALEGGQVPTLDEVLVAQRHDQLIPARCELNVVAGQRNVAGDVGLADVEDGEFALLRQGQDEIAAAAADRHVSDGRRQRLDNLVRRQARRPNDWARSKRRQKGSLRRRLRLFLCRLDRLRRLLVFFFWVGGVGRPRYRPRPPRLPPGPRRG